MKGGESEGASAATLNLSDEREKGVFMGISADTLEGPEFPSGFSKMTEDWHHQSPRKTFYPKVT